jgi:hypothetical protein
MGGGERPGAELEPSPRERKYLMRRNKIAPRELACGDAEALPFRYGCFDAATLTFALEHTVDPKIPAGGFAHVDAAAVFASDLPAGRQHGC